MPENDNCCKNCAYAVLRDVDREKFPFLDYECTLPKKFQQSRIPYKYGTSLCQFFLSADKPLLKD